MKILIVDDHKIMRDGLRSILEKHEGLVVVGEAADGRTAIELARTVSPDVVVMDVSMGGLNGIDATRQLVSELPEAKVVGLSMNSDRRYVMAMLAAGAKGYVLKNDAADELVRALQSVASGRTYLSPHVTDVVVESAVGMRPAQATSKAALSSREREVLQLIAEGHTSKDIATRLHIAVSTVETHRRQMMEKLGLHSVAELTKFAVREGLTSLDS